MKFLFFRGFYSGMKRFSSKVVDITNFIILLPVYFLGLGMSWFFSKLKGRQFLDITKFDKKSKTYWKDKSQNKKVLDDYYNQF